MTAVKLNNHLNDKETREAESMPDTARKEVPPE